eukprot:6178-Pyramimonas_sp.AAC.1
MSGNLVGWVRSGVGIFPMSAPWQLLGPLSNAPPLRSSRHAWGSSLRLPMVSGSRGPSSPSAAPRCSTLRPPGCPP